ncbi:unnamed protein product [Brassica oleracea]|uniref:(rape) hypothetical protein n=1 Tax=Brassica napus TaxID=3708 RepID=A0A816L457_BRANA|nr:unnamed protein product [Brassica napus]
MFPRWDFDVEDSAAENIIKVMFNAKPRWKWTMDCWEVAGTKPSVKKDVADAMRDGFGMLLKEIKLLGDRMKYVEKKVGITKKGTASNDLQITASSPPKCGQEPGSESVNGAKAGQNDAQEPSSSKELSLVVTKEPEVKPSEQSGEPSVLVLDKGAPTVSDVHQGESRRQTKKAKAMEFFRGKSE